MASFPLTNAQFSYPILFNPKFENVFFELHPPNFVRRELRLLKKFSLQPST